MSSIQIACAADEKYLPHCAAMLHSVFATTIDAEIVVNFTHFSDFSPEKLEIFETFIHELGGRFNALCIANEDLAKLPSTEALPPVVWQRVLLPHLLPGLDKVLYLDSDLIVVGSIEPLWDFDVDGYFLAAVTNPMHEEMSGWPEKIGLPDEEAYFNSGVMLLNLALLRETGSAEKIVRQAVEHPELVHWGDQCAMNVLLFERRYRLHPKWNMMNNFSTFGRGGGLYSDATMAEALADPQIIHFEGPPQGKPWHYSSVHPQREKYRMHRAETPWPLDSLEGRNALNIVKKRLVPRRLLEALRSTRHRAAVRRASRSGVA